ncbi:hypothetical protein [Tahibacter caeni]|uniref:hypothetical protein n=1 Tax=Tahibacter caeni TaxID=1453545 RepID=UPI0021487057|nr:hypothetical protein [Tahibacter caeni]
MKPTSLLRSVLAMTLSLVATDVLAQVGVRTGTTCGQPSNVNDLSFGAYLLPGPDVVYTVSVPYPSASGAILRSVNADDVLALAICSEPPSPTAHCVAATAAAGQSAMLQFALLGPLAGGTRWVVVDSTNSGVCGSHSVTITGPLDD